jgi:hypothetical protein
MEGDGGKCREIEGDGERWREMERDGGRWREMESRWREEMEGDREMEGEKQAAERGGRRGGSWSSPFY